MEPHSDRSTSTLPSPVPVPRASMPARAGGGEGLVHYLVTLSDGTYAIIGAHDDDQARRLAAIAAEARGLSVLDTSSASRPGRAKQSRHGRHLGRRTPFRRGRAGPCPGAQGRWGARGAGMLVDYHTIDLTEVAHLCMVARYTAYRLQPHVTTRPVCWAWCLN